jgi:LysR family transcriptional regulator (chromosome initiation inhibitor)
MLDYTHLETLEAVLRLGSFDAAAAHLHITQSAVSQRIKHLEDSVGTPLILRGQPCRGTETGLRLARHLQDVALLESRLLPQNKAPRARLRIAVNADSLGTWVLKALAQVPDQLYEIIVDDQDHSADWLKRGEVSAAVTAIEKPPQGCTSYALGHMSYVASASPAFVQNHFPNGVNSADLRHAPALVFNRKDRLQDQWMQTHMKVIHRPPTQQIPSTTGFVDAAELGMGWGMNPRVLIAEKLAQGQLVPLIENSDLAVPLFWQTSRLMAEALKPVTDAIRKTAARELS